jgi:L-2-hydroxyglutarate oxidase LhgO
VVVYNSEVTDIQFSAGNYTVSFRNLDYTASSAIVINSAGLWCDTISKMVGITDYQLHICKGEYYKTSLYRHQINSLIYPLPTDISLGLHIVLHLDGTIGFGPNAYYVDEIDYSMDDSHKNTFLTHINRYLNLPEDALIEDFTGIRPKIQAPGEPSQDFIIVNEADKGNPCKHRLSIYALAFPRTIILPYPWKVPIIVSAIPPKHGFSARLQILLSMVMRKLAMRFSDWLRPLFRECILPLIQS